MTTDRRTFINVILSTGLLGWLGSLLYPVVSYLKPPKVPEANINSVKAGLAADFLPNTGEIIKFGRKPVLLIRTEAGDFLAFEATCTHLDCIVQFSAESKQIFCACHNGIYDLRGRNVSGPPPKPLNRFTVNIINNEIVVSKPKQES